MYNTSLYSLFNFNFGGIEDYFLILFRLGINIIAANSEQLIII